MAMLIQRIGDEEIVIKNEYISCRRRTRATRCITANVLQRWTLIVINLRPN